MRLVRTVKLFFREGNSDKTYEIDLCETGPDQYLVNFRYGKRGSTLREGTKTVTAVTLTTATVLFNALEKEKRSKGYRGEHEAVVTAPELPFAITADTEVSTDIRHKAILQRLEDALTGKNSFKTTWKTSRVIWKAGEYKLQAAVPYLIQLAEKGDAMQRYAAIWALGKCGDATAAPLLTSYFENKSSAANIRQLAANALLLVLPATAKAQQLQYFMQGLPVVFQEAIRKSDTHLILQLLQDRVRARSLPVYPMLEELYILAADNAAVKQALLIFLQELPLRPPYFQHIRHLFKQAALRDDHQLVALLAGRFEREHAMFVKKTANEDQTNAPQVYVEELQQYLKAGAELKKQNSRLAYSSKTRDYLHRQVLRQLRQWGTQEDITYVRLATALLLQYDESRDATAPYQTTGYGYLNGRYTSFTRQYPAHAAALYLNYILQGNAPNMRLQASNKLWYFIQEQAEQVHASDTSNVEDTAPKTSFFKKLFGWLGGNKTPPPPKWTSPERTPEMPPETTPAPTTDIPFLALWQQLPEAFIQLLIKGRMEVVHSFALEQLKAHPDYRRLKNNMGTDVIRELLLAAFPLPQQYGFELAKEKYDPAVPSLPLIQAMLYSPLAAAQELGLQWVTQHQTYCFADNDFIIQLIFCPWVAVQQFVNTQLSTQVVTIDKARLLAGKAITWLRSLSRATPAENDTIHEGCLILEQHCRSALGEVEIRTIEALLQSRMAANQAFAARLLLLKQHSFNFDGVPDGLFHNLLANDYAPVRAAGMAIITAMPPEQQLKRPELILHCCIAPYQDTRQQIRLLLPAMIQLDNRLAIWLVNELVPKLMRKEASAGIHQDMANILSNELVNYLHDINTATALRLLYANYPAAQEFGVLVLEKYIPPAALSLKQVIATGNHELLTVRTWCWHFFEQNIARIRYERDTAIALLDASWEDTRQFAKTFFTTQFSENDWTPETLIAIADSVRPDIQAFGRELLTRYFNAADGTAYLLKLSQHPSVNMQVFATTYLESYATNNLAVIQSLEHYFRSVLTRVNKARVAKDRIFTFLEKEALRSADAASYIGNIITDISATVSIGDKARCIAIMCTIRQQFDVPLPIHITPVRETV